MRSPSAGAPVGRQAKSKVDRRGKRAVAKELKRQGVFDRLAELERVFYDPKFRGRLNDRMLELAGTADDPKSVQDVADLATKLARDEFGIDTTDCTLTVDWRPELGRKLMPEFHPSFDAVKRAQDTVAARAAKAAA